MRVVAAADKFRGTATAAEIARAVGSAAIASGWHFDSRPMADGGEGLLEALGGANRASTVTGPLGDLVDAPWRLVGSTAVIEMARASGLELVGGPQRNDAVSASSFGTGELIGAAIDAGARRIIVGAGGSATTDGGLGALRGLPPTPRLAGIELIVACDVRTRFVDAAEVFAPQKGASPAQVELLRRRLERLAQIYLDESHGAIDVTRPEGGGAAGGLAGGLMTVGARLVEGAELVADEIGLADVVELADLVVTGEGHLDELSFHGKVVGSVIDIALELDVAVLVVAGSVEPGLAEPELDDPRVTLVDLSARFGHDRAIAEASTLVEQVVVEHLAS